MTQYQNLTGKSNIAAYEINESSIIIEFKSGKERFYKYAESNIGAVHFQKMKELAVAGAGLNGYVMNNKEVKTGYKSKW